MLWRNKKSPLWGFVALKVSVYKITFSGSQWDPCRYVIIVDEMFLIEENLFGIAGPMVHF